MNSLKTTNYAGRTVWSTLGFIWLGWAVLMAFMGMWGLALATSAVFALGLLDDLFGSGESKGFRGHLKALMQGILTTGGIKLFGISLISLLYAYYEVLGYGANDTVALLPRVILALIAGAAIALTSNFLNLLDLRPGRAAKVYLLLIALVAMVVMATSRSFVVITPVILFALPILTVILPDLREKGMLGDAGANTAGFIAGALVVTLLSGWGMGSDEWISAPYFWAIFMYLLVMLALNLASERVSYSQIIDNNPLLKKLDNIGRLKNGE